MSDNERYIISFIVDNQPESRPLDCDRHNLSPDEAQALLKQTFPELRDARLTDVQVQKRAKPDEGDNIPGHYQQP
ncbi:hypothetical protein AO069_04640 [Pseudomonas syringae pv. syringae PD2774]|uniref:hypothetical protein n=1 Tax=Pseudomonas syringae TaxID=317 RepID=UPI000736F744|nr:hypothetical protein [Pseudomonas syringae]KTB94059.1 hypothetical protein AO069_04640 [Pseudomonas syringae pv. syringae PD2774]